jgi:hypothetical protein
MKQFTIYLPLLLILLIGDTPSNGKGDPKEDKKPTIQTVPMCSEPGLYREIKNSEGNLEFSCHLVSAAICFTYPCKPSVPYGNKRPVPIVVNEQVPEEYVNRNDFIIIHNGLSREIREIRSIEKKENGEHNLFIIK